MSALGRVGRIARPAALLVLGSLALHQLRYLLAFGGDASGALHAHGHAYLVHLLPVLLAGAAAALAVSVFLRALLDGHARGAAGRARSAGAFALVLLAVFCVQEIAEGALAAGHPSGLDALLAGSGWIALPLAFALGMAAALSAALLDRAERSFAEVLAARPPSHRRPRSFTRPANRPERRPLASLQLAFGLARRPPPPAPGR